MAGGGDVFAKKSGRSFNGTTYDEPGRGRSGNHAGAHSGRWALASRRTGGDRTVPARQAGTGDAAAVHRTRPEASPANAARRNQAGSARAAMASGRVSRALIGR